MNQPDSDLGPISPLKLPPAATHAVILGGLFDPPHLAHSRIPPAVRDRRFGEGAWLVYVPAARSPHKEQGPAASDADRQAMVRLATRAVDRSIVWSDEIDRGARSGGPSYTVDTLRRARALIPESVKLAMLIGSDQAAVFHTWREPREILALAEPVVMLRPPHALPDHVMALIRGASFWNDAELARWESAVDGKAVMDMSSTALRALLAANDAGASTILDARVLAYIQSHGLYGASRSA